jgi:CRP-like cAMP-binding protein
MQATTARTHAAAFNRISPALIAEQAEVGDDLAAFDHVGTVVTLRRDTALFREGEPARCCYKVLTGAVRSCRLLADGRRHIGEFLLPGDFIAVEAADTYRFTLEAVTDATVMRYPRAAIERLVQQRPQLGKSLLGLVCGGLSAAQSHMLLLGRKSAVERLASFLLMMATRNGGADRVSLPMTRGDIADYLGLTTETVSRIFSQFKTQGVIQIRANSEVLLRHRDALEDIADAA